MTQEELVSKTNDAISELVYDKVELQKAYNYYNCKRDKELFKYLEENFGIGLPTQINFTPLIRKHIDALIGEYLGLPILPKISCKDTKTINNIFREKQLKIANEVANLLLKNLQNNLLRIVDNKNMTDLNIKELLDKLIEDINENFISEYEIAGLNVVEYIILSRNIDLITKLKQLFTDLLVSGFDFYKVHPSSAKNNIQLRCLDPLNVFPELDYNSPYVNDSHRIVIRTYLTRNQILNQYGKELTKEQIEEVLELWRDHVREPGSFFVRSCNPDGTPATDGILAGVEVYPGFPNYMHYRYYDDTILPVYEVEWKEVDKDFVELRYSTIRIGEEIYILRGLDDKVIRSQDCPEKVKLSVNGVYFNNRGTEPYSMMINCMTLLDRYDLLNFYRDNLIASSGSVGDFINLPTLPTILGNDLSERLMKWKAYKKLGLALIDTSQEGQVNTGQTPINTFFNGFDDTVKVQAILAIQLAIESIEQTASSITGVFRERLNGIQQKDAVTNVQTGINNSFIVTKQWHFLMDLLTREILLDALDCAKIVYDKGLTGTLILGDKYQKIFTALPKYFTVTDFDIHLITSSEILKEMNEIKMLVPEFVKSGIMSPEALMEIVTSKGLTEMKLKVNKSIKKLKEENNLILQLTQLVEELLNTLELTQSQLKQATLKIETLNESKLLLEQQKIKLQYEVDTYKAKTERTFKENQAKNDDKRTEIEYMLLYDRNPYNDKIHDI